MNSIFRAVFARASPNASFIHTSAVANKNWFHNNDQGANQFLRHNKTVFEPEEGLIRPAVSPVPARLELCVTNDPPISPLVCVPRQDQH